MLQFIDFIYFEFNLTLKISNNVQEVITETF
jgi:hypothetical protein